MGNIFRPASLDDNRLSREVVSPSELRHVMFLDLISYYKICPGPNAPGRFPEPTAAGTGRTGQRYHRHPPTARAGSHSPAFVKKISAPPAESRGRSFGGACQAPGWFDLHVVIRDSFCSPRVSLLAIFLLSCEANLLPWCEWLC